MVCLYFICVKMVFARSQCFFVKKIMQEIFVYGFVSFLEISFLYTWDCDDKKAAMCE